MRILVTGGAGFIGSAVVRHLLSESGHTVLNYDKLTYAGTLTSLAQLEGHPRYQFCKGDICDGRKVAQLLASFDPDAVMHLAAESHVDRSIDSPNDFVQTNVVGTYVLLQASLAHWRSLPPHRQERFRLHHISTDEVFGSIAQGAFTEETRYDPCSPYSASKAASDHLVRAWGRTFGLPVLLSNCSNNYGPYQFPEKLIPLMIIKAMAGEPLPVYGAGENVRDWLFVEDHARALRFILERGQPGETYNVGGCSERSNIEVVRAICTMLDELEPLAGGGYRTELVTFVPDRPGHDFRYAIDFSKIRRELGWQPQENFETGLARTIKWYRDNPAWWRPLRERRYGGERLGLARSA